MQSTNSLTARLRLYSSDDPTSADLILREVLPKLREIAVWKLSRSVFSLSESPTELLHETWASRLHRGPWNVESREHFFAFAGLAMQQVLVDLARRRVAQRRGEGAVHVSLENIHPDKQPSTADAEQVLAIDFLIEQLAKADAITAAVVRAHYISGMSLEEIAKEAGLTLRQVRHRWDKGKLWLAARLAPRHAGLKKR
ncbi:MAG: hypothetical protein JOY53_13405 [Acidobacteriaceae bacterium]|nr:hypothetical protein [Acidobacteriaceae bacterium]